MVSLGMAKSIFPEALERCSATSSCGRNLVMADRKVNNFIPVEHTEEN